MSQQILHACPNITCRAFGEPFEIECKDGPPYGHGFYEAILDDHMECGACDCSPVPAEMLQKACEALGYWPEWEKPNGESS